MCFNCLYIRWHVNKILNWIYFNRHVVVTVTCLAYSKSNRESQKFSPFAAMDKTLPIVSRPHKWEQPPWSNIPNITNPFTKTRLYRYIENFTIKNCKFPDTNFGIFFFHISAQNKDFGYSLEPPRRGGSNEYPKSMFLSRNMKNNVPLKTPVLLYKCGV